VPNNAAYNKNEICIVAYMDNELSTKHKYKTARSCHKDNLKCTVLRIKLNPTRFPQVAMAIARFMLG